MYKSSSKSTEYEMLRPSRSCTTGVLGSRWNGCVGGWGADNQCTKAAVAATRPARTTPDVASAMFGHRAETMLVYTALLGWQQWVHADAETSNSR